MLMGEREKQKPWVVFHDMRNNGEGTHPLTVFESPYQKTHVVMRRFFYLSNVT